MRCGGLQLLIHAMNGTKAMPAGWSGAGLRSHLVGWDEKSLRAEIGAEPFDVACGEA